MRKNFTIFLILVFVLGLVPINFSEAITQNQINAEIQIVCPDNYGNWFSGSGTIIDPKGIILTNKHVVTDEKGGMIKACYIGFVESINAEPNFGTESNPNIAEVKYYTTTDDMDAAILYLDNKTNKIYPYIDIWGSNSNSLKFGDKLEVIGFPGIGGSTITYTSGDFSGFGSKMDGTQNYIKSSAQLEHGNSGGASYNPKGQFVGIPTMVVAGSLNSLSYVLSVDSIKNWLSGFLGKQYEEGVIVQEPIIEKPVSNLQGDITPPKLENAEYCIKNSGCLSTIDFAAYNEATGERLHGDSFDGVWLKRIDNTRIVSDKYRNISLFMEKSNLEKIDTESGIYSVFYKYSNNITALNSVKENEYKINSNDAFVSITPVINLPLDEGTYYISIKFKDKAGNISNSYILSYMYLQEHYKNISNIKFYSDSTYKNLIGDYDFNFSNKNFFKYCVTKYKNVYVKWEYEKQYNGYLARSFSKDMYDLTASDLTNNKDLKIISNNKYSILALDKAKKNNEYYGANICMNKTDTWCHTTGKLTSFLLKPVDDKNNLFLEGKNIAIKFAYNPNFSKGLLCGDPDYNKLNNFNQPYYILEEGNSINNNQINKLKGLILLQVESHGEAWYVNPKTGKRHYMANGNEAYKIMRYLGVGIKNIDLEKIKTNKNFAKRFSGRIFLQVESHGEAYYVDFNGVAYYLKDGSAAFSIMRELGLGITNNDLSKIPEGNL